MRSHSPVTARRFGQNRTRATNFRAVRFLLKAFFGGVQTTKCPLHLQSTQASRRINNASRHLDKHDARSIVSLTGRFFFAHLLDKRGVIVKESAKERGPMPELLPSPSNRGLCNRELGICNLHHPRVPAIGIMETTGGRPSRTARSTNREMHNFMPLQL